MDTVTKEVVLGKEVSELADGLENMVVASYTALKDGFQAGQDLPAILTSAVIELPTAIGGLEKLGSEWSEDEAGFVLAFAIAGRNAFKKINAMKVVA
jgi:hypothetical protein